MPDRPLDHIWRILGATLVAAGLILAVGACDLTQPVDRHSLVVEAFLRTGEELPTITLRQTRPLGAPGDERANAATGADIELLLEARSVSYRETDEAGRYRPVPPAGSLSSRTPWSLDVQWNGERARAQGMMPPPIQIREMCVEVPSEPVEAILVDSLRRDSLDIPAEQGYLYPVDVSLRWSAEELSEVEDTTQWVRPKLTPDTTESGSRVVSFFLQPDEVRREDRFQVRNGRRRWRGVYAVPVDDSTSSLPEHDLAATLVRGDTSFAAFARSRNDPERREPLSNVQGGLGIATAVAGDSLRRAVTPSMDQCWVP